MEWIVQYDLHFIFRLLIASICGFLIGLERKSRAKEAGVRTHCLVACASALLMIISKYAYDDLANSVIATGLDPSRVASTVVSGIGFLGAGMIFVHKRTITGLTTAAGIWATAGIGLCIGSGMYIVGAAATIIILLVQVLLHGNVKWLQKPKLKLLRLQCGDEPEMQQYAVSVLREFGISVNDVSIKKDMKNKRMEFRFQIELPGHVQESELLSKFNCDCSLMLSE